MPSCARDRWQRLTHGEIPTDGHIQPLPRLIPFIPIRSSSVFLIATASGCVDMHTTSTSGSDAATTTVVQHVISMNGVCTV